jgi:hypothetical protein
MVLEIQSSSCRLAGKILCTYLFKMMLALYNTDPVFTNQNKNKIESFSSKKVYKFIDIHLNEFN